MKTILLYLGVTLASVANGQSLNEKEQESMVSLTSPIIDYEVYHDKVVVLTQKNNQYFVYFTDSKGEKLFETIDMHSPSDLAIDCMGNLFVVGADSAMQLHVSNYVDIAQRMDVATYTTSIASCDAYFGSTLVRNYDGNTLVYEPVEEEAFEENPVLAHVQFPLLTSTRSVNVRLSGSAASDRPSVEDTRPLNMRDDGFTKPWNSKPRNVVSSNYGSTQINYAELSAFEIGDSLWVMNHTYSRLMFYSDSGKTLGAVKTQPISSFSYFEQDRTTQEVYNLASNGSSVYLNKLNHDGSYTKLGHFRKGFRRGYVKISGGYLYYRDSKGKGESIKRVKIN